MVQGRIVLLVFLAACGAEGSDNLQAPRIVTFSCTQNLVGSRDCAVYTGPAAAVAAALTGCPQSQTASSGSCPNCLGGCQFVQGEVTVTEYSCNSRYLPSDWKSRCVASGRTYIP